HTKKPAERCAILVARGVGIMLTGSSYVPQAPSNTRFVPLLAPDLTIRVALLWRKDAAGPETLRLLEWLRRNAPARLARPGTAPRERRRGHAAPLGPAAVRVS
ncbi:MAG TPA: hypothetical protein VD838_20870, partial [Anaeromyxobacteraceae bacterium]|nr:hypothetical protein [Anaeromyxobacteraceae bacterium]